MRPLYHYTCDHGRHGLGEGGLLFPADQLNAQQEWPGPARLAWMTDLAHPLRDALGLTSHILSCDRTVHRYRVTDPSRVVPWTQVRRAYRWAAELESAEGARPAHWYVSGVPVRVVYDPILAEATT